MHQRSAIIIHLPFQDGKVRLDGRSVGEHGCQTTTERTQALESTWGADPSVVERRLVIVIIDHVTHDHASVVQFEQLVVLCLDLLDVLIGQDFQYMLSKWVKHLIEKLTLVQLDQLSRHHKRRILLRSTIGVIPFGLDRLHADEQCQHLLGDVIDHILLISCFHATTTVSREPTLIFDEVNNRHGWDA
jgi:hypothetical protein